MHLPLTRRIFGVKRAVCFGCLAWMCAGVVFLSVAAVGAAGVGEGGELPAQVDLRPAFERLGLERRQQGERPTCSVFTMVGALEFALGDGVGGERLSVEYLNWAGNQAAGRAEDGGFFSDLWAGYERHGICLEREMKYRRRFDAGHGPDGKARASARERLGRELRLEWLKAWDVKTGLSEGQFRSIQATLARGWPVCAGLRWPKAERWEAGVLGMCGPEEVRDGHSVLLVGYRDEAGDAGGGVFIFRNSNHGGRDGFMPYAYARAYVNDAVWIGVGAAAPGAAGAADNFSDEKSDTVTDKGSEKRSDQAYDKVYDKGIDEGWGGLLGVQGGRNRRVSSNQQPAWDDANLDMTLLAPGERCEAPLLKGPGMINHMWFTSHAGRVNELNALTLRIYWDGRAEPGVEAPLGEFFAVGQGQPAVVNSFPVQVSSSGSLSCYWRMPFARSARIVVSNDNPDRTAGLYWQVDYVELEELPAGTPYFYARYRQEYPARAGRNYVVADLEGKGHFVGAVMSVTLGQDGWWGEGDDFFFVDGEVVPSLQGTGSEDYFNDAWGFRPRTSLWFGQPRWQGDQAGDSGVCYRWHVLDPVGFRKSLRFELEHKGNHEDAIEGFYVERPDFLNSVAFWYQTGEPKRFGELPPYPERRVPWEQHHLVRAFRQVKTTGKVPPQVQFAGMFGARPVLGWNPEPEARLAIPFAVGEPGRYAVRLTAGAGPGYGVYEVSIDGKAVAARQDFQAVDFEEMDLALGTHELSEGEHELAFRLLAGESQRAGPLSIELLRLLKLPAEAGREIKNHNEAHFIRLGIGRAVYAYRLAYGELPESLERLVTAGLLPSRYLADQNHVPLKARRDGEAFVVESTGPEPWKHSWQGLDARR